ncbi:conserved hypothetical protein [Ricinus communis]|uniref:Uncharacterized protein n=1 Tax=Ricinus communis TaxID=3988 RepID=B9TF93_RICCO|nr:conserved hypothetical protein [Ricinus communis]
MPASPFSDGYEPGRQLVRCRRLQPHDREQRDRGCGLRLRQRDLREQSVRDHGDPLREEHDPVGSPDPDQ